MSVSPSEDLVPARMSLGRTHSVGLNAFEAKPVEVQANVGQGLPSFAIGGNVDASLREGRDRIRAAISNSGFTFPDLKVTVNLSPATMPKRGSAHDLAIAVAILAARDQVSPVKLSSTVMLGELALDGGIRPVAGVLPAVIEARNAGFARAVVPLATVAEASLVSGIEVGGARTLGRWCGGWRGRSCSTRSMRMRCRRRRPRLPTWSTWWARRRRGMRSRSLLPEAITC